MSSHEPSLIAEPLSAWKGNFLRKAIKQASNSKGTMVGGLPVLLNLGPNTIHIPLLSLPGQNDFGTGRILTILREKSH